MKSLLLSLLCLVTYSSSEANIDKVFSLPEAMAKKLVSVKATANGGANGKCLAVTIENNLSSPLYVNIDHAMIFKPEDEVYQNLVVVSDELIQLQPYEKLSKNLQTFCGKSYGHGPKKGHRYNFWKKGDSIMVVVASFIKTHSLYDGIGQAAIWALTNDHSLANIYSYGEPVLSRKLVNMMAEMLKKTVPEYYTVRRAPANPNGLMYDPVIEKYVVELSWDEPIYRNMHVTVYKENGDVYRTINEESATAQTHSIVVMLDPFRDPEGIYYVQLWDDENRTYKRVKVPVEKQTS